MTSLWEIFIELEDSEPRLQRDSLDLRPSYVIYLSCDHQQLTLPRCSPVTLSVKKKKKNAIINACLTCYEDKWPNTYDKASLY